jgi:hypothetical protein
MEVDKTAVTYGSDDEMTPREDLDGRQFFGNVAIELVLTFVPFERVEFVTVQIVIAAQFGIMTGVNFQRNCGVHDPQGRRTCCQCPHKTKLAPKVNSRAPVSLVPSSQTCCCDGDVQLIHSLNEIIS